MNRGKFKIAPLIWLCFHHFFIAECIVPTSENTVLLLHEDDQESSGIPYKSFSRNNLFSKNHLWRIKGHFNADRKDYYSKFKTKMSYSGSPVNIRKSSKKMDENELKETIETNIDATVLTSKGNQSINNMHIGDNKYNVNNSFSQIRQINENCNLYFRNILKMSEDTISIFFRSKWKPYNKFSYIKVCSHQQDIPSAIFIKGVTNECLNKNKILHFWKQYFNMNNLKAAKHVFSEKNIFKGKIKSIFYGIEKYLKRKEKFEYRFSKINIQNIEKLEIQNETYVGCNGDRIITRMGLTLNIALNITGKARLNNGTLAELICTVTATEVDVLMLMLSITKDNVIKNMQEDFSVSNIPNVQVNIKWIFRNYSNNSKYFYIRESVQRSFKDIFTLRCSYLLQIELGLLFYYLENINNEDYERQNTSLKIRKRSIEWKFEPGSTTITYREKSNLENKLKDFTVDFVAKSSDLQVTDSDTGCIKKYSRSRFFNKFFSEAKIKAVLQDSEASHLHDEVNSLFDILESAIKSTTTGIVSFSTLELKDVNLIKPERKLKLACNNEYIIVQTPVKLDMAVILKCSAIDKDGDTSSIYFVLRAKEIVLNLQTLHSKNDANFHTIALNFIVKKVKEVHIDEENKEEQGKELKIKKRIIESISNIIRSNSKQIIKISLATFFLKVKRVVSDEKTLKKNEKK